MTRFLGLPLLAAGVVVACGAQVPTLADELRAAGIPETTFTGAELVQTVNAEHARNGNQTYLSYMRADSGNLLLGFPQIVSFDATSNTVHRNELAIGDDDQCCGSPTAVQFTHSYVLLTFHNTPSASTIVVVNNALQPVEILFGIEWLEVAPDELVFVENMIHFAPAHPERLRYVNLRTGENQELFPSKGDPKREAFARQHKLHLPPPNVCQETNDPCDPDLYDEDIQFLNFDHTARFVIQVSRNAVHAMSKGAEPEAVLSDSVLYVYARQNGRWSYCDEKLPAMKGDPGCEPRLPVIPVGGALPAGPFVKKLN